MMPQYKVMITRFPYGNVEHPDTVDGLIESVTWANGNPKISEVLVDRIADTPITMTRNRAVKRAREAGVDYLVMIDNDMSPDAYLATNPYRIGTDPLAKPFLSSTFDFMIEHDGPCVVGAPYCGPPPHENIFVFLWRKFQSDHPNGEVDVSLQQYEREEAAIRTGFEEVAALPTGLIMLDMRIFDKLEQPWFDYEWKDREASEKASTEDVMFSREVSLSGFPIYCNWDAWAGHWKPKCVGKPQLLPISQLRRQFVEVVKRDLSSDERLTDIIPNRSTEKLIAEQ